jgi:triosephosphate isomerase (TIM)
MRTKILAANWKMNLLFHEAEDLIDGVYAELDELIDNENQIIICPPFPYLEMAVEYTDQSNILIGAQNCHWEDKGAFTGEVSPGMLKSLDVDCCIVGHSERRKHFGETNEMLLLKVKALMKNDITPIFCCGELLDERNAGNHFDVVEKQLNETIFTLDSFEFLKLIIAYEPVWAIGTGVNATPEQAQEMHAFIRSLIQKQYGKPIADGLSILYGGSCNASNAKELFAMPDVDGGLIGGASLKLNEFCTIFKSL